MFKVVVTKKTISVAAVVVLVLIVLTGIFHRHQHSSTFARGQGMQAVPVQTVTVQSGDLSDVNTLTGTISASLQTAVGTKISGKVQAVYADIGQAVHRGQVLARLDPSDLQKQLAQLQAQVAVDEAQVQSARDNFANSLSQARTALEQARANYEQALADYRRYETLYDNGAATQQQLEEARLKMDNARSQMQAAEKAYEVTQKGDSVTLATATLKKDQAAAAIIEQQLNELAITSPVDGVVASKNIEIGEMVSPQTVLFNIAQIDPVLVTVNVTEQVIAGIHPGTQAKVTVPELGEKVFNGTVTRVGPVLDQASHAYPVKIQIANPDQRMLPGMTATVIFNGLNTKAGIIIPVQAIVETPEGSEVFTVSKGVAHMHIVQLGAVSSDKAVVVSGLNPGEQLVVNGQSLLSDGSRVLVVKKLQRLALKD
ncbi:efflux RND transporter periplasmic adaptor subunit [Desulfofundulus sp.]|uniref:efflux RND transporter periplasmic adaptor subunit n=1 Tax=Desulfofundulus sp. TaxID=2282750 RepID=UPI003C713926